MKLKDTYRMILRFWQKCRVAIVIIPLINIQLLLLLLKSNLGWKSGLRQGDPYYRPNHRATGGFHWGRVFTDAIARFSLIKINVAVFSLCQSMKGC